MRTTIAFSILAAVFVPAFAHADDPPSPSEPTGGFGTFPAHEGSNSVDLATGTAITSYPIAFPHARGGVQPIFGLAYRHNGRPSEIGEGWSFNLPVIEKRGPGGAPPFGMAPAGEADHYELDGTRLIQAECGSPPFSWWESPQWTCFRPIVEHASYTRAFLSGDGLTWRVISNGGTILEFGQPHIAAGATKHGEVDFLPGQSTGDQAYRWRLTRQADAWRSTTGGPRNVIVYRWHVYETPVLTDIFYTPSPDAGIDETDAESYAHHIHIQYQAWGKQPALVDVPGWLRTPDVFATWIDVTSKGPDPTAPRELVRRYHLGYDVTSWRGRPFLVSIFMQGRCATTISEQIDPGAPSEVDGKVFQLPSTSCDRMPETTFDYTAPGPIGRTPVDVFLDGSASAPSPNNSTMVDVNRDGLPDLVQSVPFAVFVNQPTTDHTARHFVQHSLTDNAGLSTAPNESLFSNLGGLNVFGNWYVAGSTWDSAFGYKRGGAPQGDPFIHAYFVASPLQTPPNPSADVFELHATTSTGPIDGHPNPVTFGDLDGDGLVDMLFSLTDISYELFALSRRDATKTVHGFAIQANSNVYHIQNPPYVALADLNGDGLADYVHPTPTGWNYVPGRGDGTFGCASNSSPCQASTSAPGLGDGTQPTLWEMALQPADPNVDGSLESPRLPYGWYKQVFFSDVTGDGRADLIYITQNDNLNALEIAVWTNLDGVHMSRTSYSIYRPTIAGLTHPRSFITDIDASGVNDIVVCGDQRCTAFTDSGLLNRPGLLSTIHHSAGATTSYTYATLAEVEADSDLDPWQSEGAWRFHSSAAADVVTSIQTSSNAPAPYNSASVMTFGYREPVFDRWKGTLRGFRRVRARRIGALTDPQPDLASDTSYVFGGCLTEDRAEASAGDCPDPDFDPWGAVDALPYDVEVTNPASGERFSSTLTHYTLRQVAGSGVLASWMSFADSADTFILDATAGVSQSSGSCPVVQAVGEAGWTGSQSCPTWAGNGANDIRHTENLDAYANVIDAIDNGLVSGSTQIDRPIRTHYEYVNPPGSLETLGIAWRASSRSVQYLAGGNSSSSIYDGPVRQQTFDYDAYGRLTAAHSNVNGTLPMARWHESGRPIAPEPPQAVPEGVEAQLGNIIYDDYGNIIQQFGATSECATATYLEPYRDLVQSTSTYTFFCLGPSLTSTVRFDRGLDTITSQSDPTSASKYYAHDTFGRLLSVTGANTVNGAPDHLEASFTYSFPFIEHGPVHWTKVVRADDDPSQTNTSWHYADSFGAPLVSFTQADTSAGDDADWIAHPAPIVTRGGQPYRWFRPWFYAGDPSAFAVGTLGGAESHFAIFDALGRRTGLVRSGDGHWLAKAEYHGLSSDHWGAENLNSSSSRYNLTSTTSLDGHGRVAHTRALTWTSPIDTDYFYTPTGETAGVVRHGYSGGVDFSRWRRFDSLGHIVATGEPNTTAGYVNDPTQESSMQGWRYAYDPSGRLVGTRDARGCGKNLIYDSAGRLVAEDWSPCLDSQPDYTPIGSTWALTWSGDGTGTELFNRWDTAEPGQDQPSGIWPFMGRLAATYDRGAHTQFSYDFRGHVTKIAKQIAKPGAPSSDLTARYTQHWFATEHSFDYQDRLRISSTGADVPELTDPDGNSVVSVTYTKRGIVGSVSGTYGTLLANQAFAADGLAKYTTMGDALATRNDFQYDSLRRLQNSSLHRTTTTQATLPATLLDSTYELDDDGNVLGITDNRNPSEWPAGAKPTTRSMNYDPQQRLHDITYDNGGDTQVSPYAAEESAGVTNPMPHWLGATARVASQGFDYDAFGNTIDSTDGQGASFDRMLGVVAATTSQHPAQITSSDGNGTPGSGRGFIATYDAAGNTIDLRVGRPSSCSYGNCGQRFALDWDEVGQLAHIRRWDFPDASTTPSYPTIPEDLAHAELFFIYSGGERIVKSVEIDGGTPRFTVDVFDSLRLKDAHFDETGGDYERTAATENVYAAGMAHVVYAPNLPGSPLHVFLTAGDHLGSTSVVIDKESGELVEAVSYQAYGATDSDYRPSRWGSFREDFRFTGKEEDVETGLQYFGARYYSPYLNRFISPDPLTVHGMAGDMNPYAYVSGRAMNATDPFGLYEEDTSGGWDPLQVGVGGGGSGGGGGGGGLGNNAQAAANAAAANTCTSCPSTNPAGPHGPTPEPAQMLGIAPATPMVPYVYLGSAAEPNSNFQLSRFMNAFANGTLDQSGVVGMATPHFPRTDSFEDSAGNGVSLAVGIIATGGLEALITGAETFAARVAGAFVTGERLGANGATMALGELAPAGGGGGRLALGISEHLDAFAARQGAATWKSFPDPMNWKTTMLERLADPNTKILFNLEGPVEVWPGVSRAARGAGGATDWELLQIQQNPQWWDTIEWWQGGTQVPNPFQ